MKYVVLLMAFGVNVSLFGQQYRITKTIGSQPYTDSILVDSKVVLYGPANQLLTQRTDLPFTFPFYGVGVKAYHVSDNGYITFRSDNPISVETPTLDPNSYPPGDAIYAFWTDLALLNLQPSGTHEVRVKTTGTSPNRTFVIAWLSVIDPATIDPLGISFAIVLKESGDFCIVHMLNASSSLFKACVGVEGYWGSTGVYVEGSPLLDFPRLTADPNDDITYNFQYSDSTVSVDEGIRISEGRSAIIYQQPTTDRISIDLPSAFTVRIVDLLGNTLYDHYHEGGRVEISCSMLPNGTYFMQYGPVSRSAFVISR